MRYIWIVLVALLSGCSTSQKTYEDSHAKELALKQEPIFQKPTYIPMPIGGPLVTPYAAQENLHDAVQSTLELLIDENPEYIFCVDQREARIGVLNAQLPKCETQIDQEKAGGIPVLIGMVDYIEGHTPNIYIQILPVSMINPNALSEGYKSGMAYGCINWVFRYQLLDTNIWQSTNFTQNPLNDIDCVKQPIEYVVLTSN